MGEKEGSRFFVELEYSCDMLSDEQEKAKRSKLHKGDDSTTSVLKKFGVGYSISLASDFHFPEPILERITKRGADGKKYELYNTQQSPAFSPICGSHHVLEFLVYLGVIRDTK